MSKLSTKPDKDIAKHKQQVPECQFHTPRTHPSEILVEQVLVILYSLETLSFGEFPQWMALRGVGLKSAGCFHTKLMGNHVASSTSNGDQCWLLVVGAG